MVIKAVRAMCGMGASQGLAAAISLKLLGLNEFVDGIRIAVQAFIASDGGE
jgi:hypothetical protein